MDTLSALLDLCEGKPIIDYPHKRTSIVELCFFSVVSMSKLMNKPPNCWRFETPCDIPEILPMECLAMWHFIYEYADIILHFTNCYGTVFVCNFSQYMQPSVLITQQLSPKMSVTLEFPDNDTVTSRHLWLIRMCGSCLPRVSPYRWLSARLQHLHC